jgi:hypothetical protein
MAGEIKASIVSAKNILFIVVRTFFEALDFSASSFIHLIRKSRIRRVSAVTSSSCGVNPLRFCCGMGAIKTRSTDYDLARDAQFLITNEHEFRLDVATFDAECADLMSICAPRLPACSCSRF